MENHLKIWKDIPGWEGNYRISNYGDVQSVKRTVIKKRYGKTFNVTIPEKILRHFQDKDGYLRVKLSRGSSTTHYSVHRLVAIAYIENHGNLPVVNHKDTNKTNNHYTNLEWCTELYNTQHAKEKGLIKGNGGLRGSQLSKKLTEPDVILIRKMPIKHGSYKLIGKSYGVSSKTVEQIIKRKTWTHI